MLDNDIKQQLTAYLERVKEPFEMVASLDDSDKSKELRELLETIASIRNDSGLVAGEISTLSDEFSKMGSRLQLLEKAASEFSRRVA